MEDKKDKVLTHCQSFKVVKVCQNCQSLSKYFKIFQSLSKFVKLTINLNKKGEKLKKIINQKQKINLLKRG